MFTRERTWWERFTGTRPTHDRDHEARETHELHRRISAKYRASRFSRYSHDELGPVSA